MGPGVSLSEDTWLVDLLAAGRHRLHTRMTSCPRKSYPGSCQCAQGTKVCFACQERAHLSASGLASTSGDLKPTSRAMHTVLESQFRPREDLVLQVPNTVFVHKRDFVGWQGWILGGKSLIRGDHPFDRESSCPGSSTCLQGSVTRDCDETHSSGSTHNTTSWLCLKLNFPHSGLWKPLEVDGPQNPQPSSG